jgi:hypothetical protein
MMCGRWGWFSRIFVLFAGNLNDSVNKQDIGYKPCS